MAQQFLEALEGSSIAFQSLSEKEKVVSRFVFGETLVSIREQQLRGAIDPETYNTVLINLFRMHLDGTIGRIVEPTLQADPTLIPIVDKLMAKANG